MLDVFKLKKFFKENYSLFLILLIGVFFRVYKLKGSSLLYDEACKLILSRESASFFAPPFTLTYSFILKAWCFFAKTVFEIKMLSVLFGVITIFLMYLIGKELFSRGVGYISAIILAVSPLHIYHSREVTQYSITVFLSILSTYVFIRALKKKQIGLWGVYVVINVANIYIHVFTLLLLVSHFVFYICYFRRYKDNILVFLIAILGIFVFTTPLFFLIFQSLGAYHIVADVPCWDLAPSVLLLDFIRNLSSGYYSGTALFILSGLFFMLLFLLSFYNFKNCEDKALLLLCLIVPIVGSKIVSFFVVEIFTCRLFMFTIVFFYILMAVGISHFNRKFKAMIIFLILIFSYFSLYSYYECKHPEIQQCPVRQGGLNKILRGLPGYFPQIDYLGLTRFMRNNFKKGDILLQTSFFTMPSMIYYTMGDEIISPVYLVIYSRKQRDLEFYKFIGFDKLLFKKYKLDLGAYERIWLVDFNFAAIDINPHAPRSEDGRKNILFLSKKFNCKYIGNYSILDIYLFNKF